MSPIRSNAEPMRRGSLPAYRREHMHEAICFFISRQDERDKLGKTKLMKLLYFADFGHYRKYQKAITWADYEKWPQGPVPVVGLDALVDLEDQGLIEQKRESVINYIQHSHVLIETFRPTALLAEEIATLEEVWRKWGGTSTAAIVEASHQEPPWLSVPMWDVIPYRTALFGDF